MSGPHRALAGLTAIGTLLRGRTDVPEGATPIGYGSAQRAFLVVMMVLAPLEILLVELLVPWAWARVVLLVAAVWGAVWLFGFYASVRVRPHHVGRDRLVLRTGHLAEVSVDVGAVRAVRRASHDGYRGLVPVADGVVAVAGMSGTAVAVDLEPGTPVHVRGRGTVLADEVRFDADDVDAAVRAVRERIR